MLRCLRILSVLGVIGALFALAPPAAASEEDEWGAGDSGDESGGSSQPESSESEEGYPAEDESKADNTDSTDPAKIDADAEKAKAESPFEKPDQTYYFAGLRYRGMIVPKFMMNLFASGGTTLYVNGFGPEVSIRKNGFESVFSMWWAGYYMPNTPFKGINEHPAAYEIVKSDLNLLYLTADFMWSTPLQDDQLVSVDYGMGAGFGIVWGDLRRNQATPSVPNRDIPPEDFVKCAAPGVPAFTDRYGDPYCDDSNKHYGKYTEDSWANGGQKPNIFPWFALQTGLRVKPHKNVATRLSLGWALTGPFFGLAAAYGF